MIAAVILDVADRPSSPSSSRIEACQRDDERRLSVCPWS
jgi:hypothetical protein